MQIFHEAYIPRRLEEVEDHEGDFERLLNAGTNEQLEGIYYQTIAGTHALYQSLLHASLYCFPLQKRLWRVYAVW